MNSAILGGLLLLMAVSLNGDKSLEVNVNGQVCGACQNLVNDVRVMLGRSQFQSDVSVVLKDSCMLVTDEELRKQCATLVNGEIQDMVTVIPFALNPRVVCGYARMCRQILTPETRTPPSQTREQSTITLPSNTTTHRKISKRLALPRGEYGPVLEMLGACLEAVGGALHSGTEKLDDESDACLICKSIFQRVRDYIDSNMDKMEFHDLLKHICTYSTKYEEKCSSWVCEYASDIYEIILKSHPAEFCAVVSLCEDPDKQRAARSRT